MLQSEDKIKILDTQYKAIRDETILAHKIRNKYLYVGLSIIGVILAAGITITTQYYIDTQGKANEEVKSIAITIFYFLVPLLSLYFCFAWYYETFRLNRASWFLFALEKEFQKNFPENDIKYYCWEKYIYSVTNQPLKYLTWYLFALIVMVSIFIGKVYLGQGWFWFACFIWLVLVIVMKIFIGQQLKIKNKKTKEVFDEMKDWNKVYDLSK